MIITLSQSSINVYLESQLQFYYQYILKSEPDTQVPVCYGLAGGLVHKFLEKYYYEDRYELGNSFTNKWKELKLDKLKGINNKPLSCNTYLEALYKGIDKHNKYNILSKETTIDIPLYSDNYNNIRLKGIIDVVTADQDNIVLVDWKTSSSVPNNQSPDLQAKMYCYLYYKKYGVIPKKFIFEYIKIGKTIEKSYSINDLLEFEKFVKDIAKELISKGTDINNYKVGNFETLFNTHKQKCLKEYLRRKNIK